MCGCVCSGQKVLIQIQPLSTRIWIFYKTNIFLCVLVSLLHNCRHKHRWKWSFLVVFLMRTAWNHQSSIIIGFIGLVWFNFVTFPFLSFYIIVLICEFRLFYLFLSYLDGIVWCIHFTRYCTVYNKLILSLSHMLFYAVFTVEWKGIFDSVTKTNASCISFCSLIYHCYF